MYVVSSYELANLRDFMYSSKSIQIKNMGFAIHEPYFK